MRGCLTENPFLNISAWCNIELMHVDYAWLQTNKSVFKGLVNNSAHWKNVDRGCFHAIKPINNSATCSIIPVFLVYPTRRASFPFSTRGLWSRLSLAPSSPCWKSILFICASVSKYAVIDKRRGSCDLHCPDTQPE